MEEVMFRKLTNSYGRPVYLNLQLVQYVAADEASGYTNVAFAEDDYIKVNETPEEVLHNWILPTKGDLAMDISMIESLRSYINACHKEILRRGGVVPDWPAGLGGGEE